MRKILTLFFVALFSVSMFADNYTISNAKIYYDDSNSQWGSNVVVAFDKSDGGSVWGMSSVANTNLWYINISWGDGAVTYMRFGSSTTTHDWYGWWSSVGNTWQLATQDSWSGVSGGWGLTINNEYKMFGAQTDDAGAELDKTDLTDYKSLNHAQTVYKYTSTDNGANYSAQELNSGTVTISAYKMTADGTADNAENSGTISDAATTSISKDAAYTGEVTLTAAAAGGYEFVGWFDGEGAEISTKNPYTYNAPNAEKSVYARFKASGETALDNTEAEVKAVKTIENGQLVIIKNGVKYNALGTEVK